MDATLAHWLESRVHVVCMQDTFLARHTRPKGRPSAARDDRVSCIQARCLTGWKIFH